MFATRTLLTLGAILILNCGVCAKSWRGLVPLHSTKADVVRLFPQCSGSASYCDFRLKQQGVFIVFSSSLAHTHETCGERLANDTVLSITVSPSTDQEVKDLRLNKTLYRKIGPSLWGYIYLNEGEGVVLNVKKGRVGQIAYVPPPGERSLCPIYYGNLEDFLPLDPHLPTVTISCPTEIEAGRLIVFTASSVDNPRISFAWTVSGGRIVGGQYSDQVSVSTEGFDGDGIIGTVEMRILGLGHIQETSCVVKIKPKKN